MRTLFVYGLLKPGSTYHHLAAPFIQTMARAHVRGRLYDDGVPAARFDEAGDIAGFVFWLRPDRVDEALAILDDLEDEGERYRRMTVTAHTSSGPVDAHAYEYIVALDPSAYVGRCWPVGGRR